MLRAWFNRSRARRYFAVAGVLGLLALGAVWGAASWVEHAASGVVFSDAEAVPARRVGLVLGCNPRLADGRANLFFSRRIEAAAALYRAGRVERLLVSGDNHAASYDEPSAMRDALVARGVPAERIALDYAGFSTFDSVVRAREVFGLREVCVISQRDHAMRAVFLARRRGLDAVGYAAEGVGLRAGLRTHVREALARVKAVADVTVWPRAPRFLGPPESIATGPAMPQVAKSD